MESTRRRIHHKEQLMAKTALLAGLQLEQEQWEAYSPRLARRVWIWVE
jgi:hypothetical protein